ncbi:MAG: hypothetical protein U0792_02545 [Gemmataceae bacterium]
MPDGSTPAVPVIAFPQMPQSERTDPSGRRGEHRVALLNQILVQVESGSRDLHSHGEQRHEVSGARRRRPARCRSPRPRRVRRVEDHRARRCKAEFEDRYRKEFLSGEQFSRFDRYRDAVMDLCWNFPVRGECSAVSSGCCGRRIAGPAITSPG